MPIAKDLRALNRQGLTAAKNTTGGRVCAPNFPGQLAFGLLANGINGRRRASQREHRRLAANRSCGLYKTVLLTLSMLCVLVGMAHWSQQDFAGGGSRPLMSTAPQMMSLVSLQQPPADQQQQPVAPAAAAPERAEGEVRGNFQTPVLLHFSGPINSRLKQFFTSRIARAERMQADLIVVYIDSPGGYLSLSLEVAEALQHIRFARTVAFVSRDAISGGAIVALGCQEIAMTPLGRIGDIGAIEFDPELFAFVYVPAKAQSYLVRHARDMAESAGRPADLVEAMIDKDVVVYRRRPAKAEVAQQQDAQAQQLEFRLVRLTEAAATPADAARAAGIDLDQWELIEESGAERFLTLNGRRAMELGLVDLNVDDLDQLRERLGVATPWIVMRPNFTDSVVFWLNTPIVTGVLIIVGLIALYIEITAPGIGAGGLIAGLCAALFFWSRFMGGTSGWLEVILFLAGLVFLAMELFVIPGWGISGLLGLALLLLAAVMASQDFIIPQTPRQWNEVITMILVLLCSGCVVLIAAAWITRRAGTLPVLNRLILAPEGAAGVSADGTTDKSKAAPPIHPLVSVGDWGITESLLRPAGRARFTDRSIDVVSDGSFVPPNCQVKVVEISGNRVMVVPIYDEA